MRLTLVEKRKLTRSNYDTKNKKIVIEVELTNNKVKRVYIKEIKDYSENI